MKIIVFNDLEFNETVVKIHTSGWKLVLTKKISETVDEFIKGMPSDLEALKIEDNAGFSNTYLITEK